ncbi:MAG: PDZ domain-containing protein [Treponema sp.]|nr:PDZ domain-containing protein [Treponema sp.]
MNSIKNSLLWGLLAFTLALVSCPNPANQQWSVPEGDEIEVIYKPGGNTVPPLVNELSYNYALLRYFYFYADEDLNPYSSYTGGGSGTPYGDVLAMYDGMQDPFTRYWTPYAASAILSQLITSGDEQKLIGMHLQVKETEAGQPDELYVLRVWLGSPAEAAGLLKDDRIIEINNVDLTADPALKGNALLEKYQEAANSDTVSLKIHRSDTDISVGPITKQVMRLPTVFLDYIDDIPVIQITEFSEDSGYDETAANKKSNTIKELKAALTQVKNGNYPVGIIDLRGNPGGSVNQCYAGIEELVAEGIYIRSEEHSIEEKSQTPLIIKTGKRAKPGGLGETIRWVFLADTNSASAAEILLCAVKNCRPETLIFGTKTYGKGIGQYYIQTYFAGGLAGITAMQFFDKDWNTYDGTGIYPDVTVDSDGALDKAIASIKQSQGRSIHGAAPPIDRAAIHALNTQLTARQVPSDGIRGGAWKRLPTTTVR